MRSMKNDVRNPLNDGRYLISLHYSGDASSSLWDFLAMTQYYKIYSDYYNNIRTTEHPHGGCSWAI